MYVFKIWNVKTHFWTWFRFYNVDNIVKLMYNNKWKSPRQFVTVIKIAKTKGRQPQSWYGVVSPVTCPVVGLLLFDIFSCYDMIKD